jgi:hypothetical protein
LGVVVTVGERGPTCHPMPGVTGDICLCYACVEGGYGELHDVSGVRGLGWASVCPIPVLTRFCVT